MKERSGMPYDVVAYEADELARALDPWQEGIFHRMLRLSWMNGSVPADLDQLAVLCRVRPSSLKKAWPKLACLWDACEHDAQRLRNKKQENERFFLESKRAVNRKNKKDYWDSLKSKENADRNVEGTLNERSTSQPSPSQPIPVIQGKGNIKQKPLSASADRSVPPYTAEFDAFWSTSTRRGSKVDAFREWTKLHHTPELTVNIQTAMHAWMQSDQWQDETKQPHVHRWLKRRGWEELVPKNGVSNGRSKAEQRTLQNLEAAHRYLHDDDG